MKNSKITVTKSVLFALALSFGAAACGGGDGGLPPEEGNAYLTIVGDRNVFLNHGAQQRLTVRYHNGSDEALAGQVALRVVGDAKGSTISKMTGVTNSQGIVELDVQAGSQDASFRIEASAEFTNNTDWVVAVSNGDPLPKLNPSGTYELDSNFDVVSGLPGEVGNVINEFVEMTDDPYDPATWIIDNLVDEIGSSTIESLLNATRPALDGVVNDYLIQYAPGFVTDILEIGDKFGQVSRQFGTISQLKVEAISGVEGSGYKATHTMTGFQFRIDGSTYDYTMDALSVDEPVIKDITFTLTNKDRFEIGAHDMPLRYGGFLALALEDVIVPLVDPAANSLHDLFMGKVNCTGVGQEMSDFIGFGSASLYKGACEVGLEAGASIIIDQIVDIDERAPFLLKINGDAKANDTNGDKKVDSLTSGKWLGSIDYAGSVGPLATDVNNFTGQRMQ